MDQYTKFLAENVLSEDKVITYRILSRTLKVHVNIAKQMLYEFHRSQNAKRPGTVHATYLVYGTKKALVVQSPHQNGSDGDIEMSSSAPEVESLAEVVPTSTLSLIPEEQLKEILGEYEDVTSIHVYSLGPHPTKDFALLVDATNQVLTLNASSDENVVPIINPKMRRRDRKGPGLKAASAAIVAAASAKPSATHTAFGNTAHGSVTAKVKKEEPASTSPDEEAAEGTLTSGPAKKPAATLKRGASSGIMQAFSKAAAKPVKVKKEAEPKPNAQPMSDDGEDDDEMPQPKPRSSSGFRTKKQREEDLRRMMEEDDEPDEEQSEKAESPEPEDEPMEEEPPAPPPEEKEEPEVVTASADGRRRGKRRVMRKKQIMDDQGYLVTIQEPGWDSFSEDEAPPPAKPKVASTTPAPTAKPKKAGPKGQGNIMSFFSKK